MVIGLVIGLIVGVTVSVFILLTRVPKVADESVAVQDSPISEHVLIREEEFNNRIAALSEELRLARGEIEFGKPAEELHPDVKNLPHTSVHQNAPDVEYSD